MHRSCLVAQFAVLPLCLLWTLTDVDAKTVSQINGKPLGIECAETVLSNQKVDEQSILPPEGKAKIVQIQGDTERQINQLENEKQEAIQANGIPLYMRGVQYYTPNNKPIEDEYNARIKEIKEQERTRINEVLSASRQRAAALENSFAEYDIRVKAVKKQEIKPLIEPLGQPKQSPAASENSAANKDNANTQNLDRMRLFPGGGDPHVKTYQVKGEPSDTDLPRLAAPAKSLNNVKCKIKPAMFSSTVL